MSIQTIEKRLTLLESQGQVNSSIIAVWKEPEEIIAQAIARRLGDMPLAHAKVIIAGWADSAEMHP